MPRYYPDLESIQKSIESVSQNDGDKKYNGIYPDTEDQLPQARQELATYFRDVWGDHTWAVEVELGLSEEDPEAQDKFLAAFMSLPWSAWDAEKTYRAKEQQSAELMEVTKAIAIIEIRVIHGENGGWLTERFHSLPKDRIGNAIERMGKRIQQFASEGRFTSIPDSGKEKGGRSK